MVRESHFTEVTLMVIWNDARAGARVIQTGTGELCLENRKETAVAKIQTSPCMPFF